MFLCNLIFWFSYYWQAGRIRYSNKILDISTDAAQPELISLVLQWKTMEISNKPLALVTKLSNSGGIQRGSSSGVLEVALFLSQSSFVLVLSNKRLCAGRKCCACAALASQGFIRSAGAADISQDHRAKLQEVPRPDLYPQSEDSLAELVFAASTSGMLWSAGSPWGLGIVGNRSRLGTHWHSWGALGHPKSHLDSTASELWLPFHFLCLCLDKSQTLQQPNPVC